jgi:hypothetical protein
MISFIDMAMKTTTNTVEVNIKYLGILEWRARKWVN